MVPCWLWAALAAAVAKAPQRNDRFTSWVEGLLLFLSGEFLEPESEAELCRRLFLSLESITAGSCG